MIGQTLGHYRIDAQIGAGGMGVVSRARDIRLGRDVALKVLPPAIADDPVRLRRFVQEARAASALSHHLNVDPQVDLLRGDRRFLDLRRCVGLPER